VKRPRIRRRRRRSPQAGESSAKAAEQIAALIEDVRDESRRLIEAVQES